MEKSVLEACLLDPKEVYLWNNKSENELAGVVLCYLKKDTIEIQNLTNNIEEFLNSETNSIALKKIETEGLYELVIATSGEESKFVTIDNVKIANINDFIKYDGTGLPINLILTNQRFADELKMEIVTLNAPFNFTYEVETMADFAGEGE